MPGIGQCDVAIGDPATVLGVLNRAPTCCGQGVAREGRILVGIVATALSSKRKKSMPLWRGVAAEPFQKAGMANF
jgi:hypothetical protein